MYMEIIIIYLLCKYLLSAVRGESLENMMKHDESIFTLFRWKKI